MSAAATAPHEHLLLGDGYDRACSHCRRELNDVVSALMRQPDVMSMPMTGFVDVVRSELQRSRAAWALGEIKRLQAALDHETDERERNLRDTIERLRNRLRSYENAEGLAYIDINAAEVERLKNELGAATADRLVKQVEIERLEGELAQLRSDLDDDRYPCAHCEVPELHPDYPGGGEL